MSNWSKMSKVPKARGLQATYPQYDICGTKLNHTIFTTKLYKPQLSVLERKWRENTEKRHTPHIIHACQKYHIFMYLDAIFTYELGIECYKVMRLVSGAPSSGHMRYLVVLPHVSRSSNSRNGVFFGTAPVLGPYDASWTRRGISYRREIADNNAIYRDYIQK